MAENSIRTLLLKGTQVKYTSAGIIVLTESPVSSLKDAYLASAQVLTMTGKSLLFQLGHAIVA